jgi:hypothetical protein
MSSQWVSPVLFFFVADREIMEGLFHMCQAELAENVIKPIWCFIFSDTDAIPMVYYMDVEVHVISSIPHIRSNCPSSIYYRFS